VNFCCGRPCAACDRRSIQNERRNQINNFTSDQEQYRPYQIVDLLLEARNGPRSHLRLRGEDVSQEENDRYCGQDYRYQLVHDALSLGLNATTAKGPVGQGADWRPPQASRVAIAVILIALPGGSK
jgi:hypothetical protein